MLYARPLTGYHSESQQMVESPMVCDRAAARGVALSRKLFSERGGWTELTAQLDSVPPLTPWTGDGACAGGGSSLSWAERAASGQQAEVAVELGAASMPVVIGEFEVDIENQEVVIQKLKELTQEFAPKEPRSSCNVQEKRKGGA
jgi:hypothetical protein